MDVVIPGHNIRLFCASLVCASRIGKDLYLEFDPINGLVLRTLNDAKSAYTCVRFLPHFFQRCTTPTTTTTSHQRRRHKRNRSSGSTATSTSPETLDHTQPEKFICRVPLRSLAPVVRQRKNELSLRIQSERTHQSNRQKQDDEEEDDEGGTLCLSFEFQWQATVSQTNDRSAAPTSFLGEPPLLRVLHRIPVSSIDHVSAAVASRDQASELQAHPSVLLRLLDPLKRTAEAALIVRANASRIHASSFHQCSHVPNQNGASRDNNSNNNNAILQANSDSLLKTETGIGCDDLNEFFFRQDRPRRSDSQEDGNGDDDNNDDMPDKVNDHVVLVFPIKEAKAFLQFCSASSSSTLHGGVDTALVDVFYHWGGRPMVFQTQPHLYDAGGSEHQVTPWKAELILATLDHSLLGSSMDAVAAAQGGDE